MASAVTEARFVDATTLPPVAIDAREDVRESLGSLGRTEDLRLAPNGRRLAIACLARQEIAVADVGLARTQHGPRLTVTSVERVTSAHLHQPHGVDWLDDERLVVANRDGGIAVLALGSHAAKPAELGSTILNGPGSLVTSKVGSALYELLVCNNWADTITRHELEDGRWTDGHVAFARWIDLPDSIALSQDGRWLAVSNHNTHCVVVFDYRMPHRDAEPVAVLRGIRYPHGLRFNADGSQLVVADAGAPVVHLFATNDEWRGAAYPTASARVMDDETFARGHHGPQEGGPKGLDIDLRTNLLLITSEHTPLTCFDLAPLLETPGDVALSDDDLLEYELMVLSTTAETKAAAERTRAELHAVLNTKAWRLTATPRRLYGAVRGVASRRRTSSRSTSSDTSSGDSATARSESSA